tara:strand:- start:629 stop:1084 length:456 start_codon:yes stop_codon:yes gene_type:complete
MFKKIITIITLMLITGCEYVPIYSVNKNKNISINSIKSVSGDRKLNISLERNLKKYKLNNSNKPFDIIIKTIYEKETISKNTSGTASKYQLKATAMFEIKHNNNTESVTFVEIFNFDRTDDDYENKIYEENIKQNFANSLTEKLIIKLSML